MSLVTNGIGLAKKAKHRFQDQLRERTPVYLSPVRRIERVATRERICAMTFDDGPCRLPPSPDRFRGKALTLVLAETLERYGARGTFDVVGDTSANYPDKAGKHGSASWGGVAYDHYPDFGRDDQGGVVHCPELVSRLLAGGHEITSHTYSHVLFGWKPLVYGRRRYLQGLEPVVADLKKLHRAMEEGWGYAIRLGRPPHYVDNIKGGFTSYDAYALMGYQYMAASFDGAGWLPLATYEAEVEATWRPMESLLLEDPDAFRGQIIFQKDGFNMARRTPGPGRPAASGPGVVRGLSGQHPAPRRNPHPGRAGHDGLRLGDGEGPDCPDPVRPGPLPGHGPPAPLRGGGGAGRPDRGHGRGGRPVPPRRSGDAGGAGPGVRHPPGPHPGAGALARHHPRGVLPPGGGTAGAAGVRL